MANACATGTNVLIEDYYGRFLTFNRKNDEPSLAVMRRPTYTFFLVIEEIDAEEISNKLIDGFCYKELTSIYRQLGCYEICLNSYDSVEDIVSTIAHIMHFFDSVKSGISHSGFSVGTE